MGNRARDVMQTPVQTIGPDATIPELDRALLEHRVGGFPVVSHGNLLGMIARSDIVRQLSVERSRAEQLSDYYRYGGLGDVPRESLESLGGAAGASLENVRVKDFMLSPAVTVAPDEPISSVARKLVEHHIHRVPVVDEGRLVGLVSTLDLVRTLIE